MHSTRNPSQQGPVLGSFSSEGGDSRASGTKVQNDGELQVTVLGTEVAVLRQQLLCVPLGFYLLSCGPGEKPAETALEVPPEDEGKGHTLWISILFQRSWALAAAMASITKVVVTKLRRKPHVSDTEKVAGNTIWPRQQIYSTLSSESCSLQKSWDGTPWSKGMTLGQ